MARPSSRGAGSAASPGGREAAGAGTASGPRKDGLVSALEFTKFVITIDAALIAFVTGATFLQTIAGRAETVVVIVVLGLLAASVGAGVLVHMRVSTMLSEGRYDLSDRPLGLPGIVNVICFVLGGAGVAALAVLKLVLAPPAPQTSLQQFEVRCAQVRQTSGMAYCRGRMVNSAAN